MLQEDFLKKAVEIQPLRRERVAWRRWPQSNLAPIIRIAGAIKGSTYRAIRELDRRNAERQAALESGSMIDVEGDEVEASTPRLIQS